MLAYTKHTNTWIYLDIRDIIDAVKHIAIRNTFACIRFINELCVVRFSLEDNNF